MVKFFHRVQKPPAQAPGSFSCVAEQKVEKVSIKLGDYFYIVLCMLSFGEKRRELVPEQISLGGKR